MAYDRDEVLARTDLASLADEFLGPHKGRGRSAMWPCPDSGHGPQTGRTPPVSMFDTSRGYQRWHCHGCGAGGTAADLVMTARGVGFGEAIEELARRTGVAEHPWRPEDDFRARRGPALRPRSASDAWRREPSPEIGTYVTACEAHLWSPGGRATRRWLEARGLDDEVLRANRVGSDPGPERLARAEGLPRGGRAAVFPVLGDDDRAIYVQARYLWPRTHKYDNPSSALAGPSPRVAEMRPTRAALGDGVVIIAEGIPDGLTAAQSGYRSVAVLGAGLPDQRVANELASRFPSGHLVVAFDADHRGEAGAAALTAFFAERAMSDRVATLAVPPEWSDLNGWRMGTGIAFSAELAARVEDVVSHLGRSRVRVIEAPVVRGGQEAELGRDLDTIHYRFVLGADPAQASANLARISTLAQEWDNGPTTPEVPRATGDGLGDAMDALCYRHLLDDDGAVAVHRREQVSAQIEQWSADLGLSSPSALSDLDRAVERRPLAVPEPREPLSMEIGP